MAAPPPERGEPWQGGSREVPGLVSAQVWDPLVLPDAPPGAPPFPCGVIRAPHGVALLVLTTPLQRSGAQAQARYRDRWPVEGLTRWAKQMLGAVR